MAGKYDRSRPEEEPLPPRHGPYSSPVERFAQLPVSVRAFLEKLTDEDIENAKAILKSYERAAVIGWAIKWIGLLMAGTFTATVTFGEGVKKIYAWFLGG